MAHTQGPWHVISADSGFLFISDLKLQRLADVHCLLDGIDNDSRRKESRANAALIAAAQDLLDIVKTVLGHIEEGESFHCTENNRKLLTSIIHKAGSK